MSEYMGAEDLVQNWTKTAKYCYSIGCRCSRCDVFIELETPREQCKMKIYVTELIRRYGIPKGG